jgi:hypothetical protein
MPYIRCLEWRMFSRFVEDHIRIYTVGQYGDAPDDQAEAWTAEQCVESIKRYTNRFGTNARGADESLRDLLKIAHYACLAYFKLHLRLGRTPPLLDRSTIKDIKKSDYVHGSEGQKDDTESN